MKSSFLPFILQINKKNRNFERVVNSLECLQVFRGWLDYVIVTFCEKVGMLVAQSCQTLCNLMDCSLPDSSVHWILQAKTLEWVAIPFSRGSSRPRNQNWISHIEGGFFTIWATREALLLIIFFSVNLHIHMGLWLLNKICPLKLFILIPSWNQDCWEKYQQPQICRWYILVAESEKEWKSLLMKVNEESGKLA